jgi:hypothetical protein
VLLRSLVDIGDPRGLRVVLVHPEGAEALSEAPVALVTRAALPALGDPDAVRTLALLPSEDYAPLIIDALSRRGARTEAIRALGSLRHRPAVPHLIPLLDSRDGDEAHRALIMITGTPLRARRADWTRWWNANRG